MGTQRAVETRLKAAKKSVSLEDRLLHMTPEEAQVSAQVVVKKHSKIIRALAKL